VLFTAHRGARPWIGETIPDDEPPVPTNNALAPLGKEPPFAAAQGVVLVASIVLGYLSVKAARRPAVALAI